MAPLIIAPDGGSAAGPVPIFQITNSCSGVKAVVNSSPIHDPVTSSDKYAAFFGADGTQTPCLLGSSTPVDVGESDIFATTCGVTVPEDTISEHAGPIQAMAFVVPNGSLQTAISAEAAREVFGMGGNGGVAKPWIDPLYDFVRNVNTGTQQMIGLAIGVPANTVLGTDEGSAMTVDQALKTSGNPGASIGIISVDWYDQERGNLNALAFKATGQEEGFLPDSNSTSTDKQNVRDGHYPSGARYTFSRQTLPRAPPRRSCCHRRCSRASAIGSPGVHRGQPRAALRDERVAHHRAGSALGRRSAFSL